MKRCLLAFFLLVGCGGAAPDPAAYSGEMPTNRTRLRGEVTMVINVFGGVSGRIGLTDFSGMQSNGTRFQGTADGVEITGTISGDSFVTAAWHLRDGDAEDDVTFSLSRG